MARATIIVLALIEGLWMGGERGFDRRGVDAVVPARGDGVWCY